MSGRAIKAKCWIITTIKAEADIRGQVKYDLVDCKITEGENALSILEDKRQTQEKRMDGMMSEGERIWAVRITSHSGFVTYARRQLVQLTARPNISQNFCLERLSESCFAVLCV